MFQHFIGHFGDDFFRSDDPTSIVKVLKEAIWPLSQALIPLELLHHVTI